MSSLIREFCLDRNDNPNEVSDRINEALHENGGCRVLVAHIANIKSQTDISNNPQHCGHPVYFNPHDFMIECTFDASHNREGWSLEYGPTIISFLESAQEETLYEQEAEVIASKMNKTN